MVKFECKMSVRVFPLRKKYRELEFCSYTLILDKNFSVTLPKITRMDKLLSETHLKHQLLATEFILFIAGNS